MLALLPFAIGELRALGDGSDGHGDGRIRQRNRSQQPRIEHPDRSDAADPEPPPHTDVAGRQANERS